MCVPCSLALLWPLFKFLLVSFEGQLCYLLMFALSESYLRSDGLTEGQHFARLAPRSVLALATICRVWGYFGLILSHSMKWESNLFFFHADFELLPPPPKCWDYRDMPSRLVREGLRFESRTLYVIGKHSGN